MGLIKIKVVPGARRSEVVGLHGDAVKIRVAAPPEDGKANRALLEILAARLDVKLASVRIVRGQSSPQKVVEVDGLDAAEILSRLG